MMISLEFDYAVVNGNDGERLKTGSLPEKRQNVKITLSQKKCKI